jgi:hypothetical protein
LQEEQFKDYMQEFAREGHFFWDFTDWKWGFSDCLAAETGELLPECGLQGNAVPTDTINVVIIFRRGSGRFK